MFDRLIESEPHSADFKDRRGYFMVSSVVVGILFLAAVVISIYAEDFNLGNGSLEMSELIAPVEMAAIAPEPPKPERQAPSSLDKSEQPSRIENMARTDESKFVPAEISTSVNTTVARPYENFVISDRNTDPIGPVRPQSGNGVPDGLGTSAVVSEKEPEPEPPPVKQEEPKKPQILRTSSVLNGKAVYLPKPPYSAAAIAVHAQGRVEVQVTIDENGRVISATVVSGHPLLRSNSEQAARNARFSPTLLSNVPVKVTGLIIYNFMRN